MHVSTQVDSSSIAPLGGTTTRARAGFDDTAEPAATSGFGALMEQEEDIQSATEGYLGVDHGRNSEAIDCILRQQATRLGANIALLDQRYGLLPHPGRGQTLHGQHARLSHSNGMAAAGDVGALPSLVAKHLDLLRKIAVLMDQRPDGQRGELILAEVARNHEQMAWTLTAFINEDESVRGVVRAPATTATPVPCSLAPREAKQGE
ncbi:MAG TPA: hypothetical protein VM029_01200 [Opitutaceae bacterium]|nr:hypothetical protein [Opitutaceae bacterium]